MTAGAVDVAARFAAPRPGGQPPGYRLQRCNVILLRAATEGTDTGPWITVEVGGRGDDAHRVVRR
jgi:hypothetical protein